MYLEIYESYNRHITYHIDFRKPKWDDLDFIYASLSFACDFTAHVKIIMKATK